MANGRIISNRITLDKKINDLSDDTSRLAFTWLITFADREGRTYGDPAVVRSMLFPRRTDITIDQMIKYIKEWHEAGLVQWYEAEDDTWISFPNFDKHQPNLRKDREAESRIPEPPGVNQEVASEEEIITPEQLQHNSGDTPAELPVKLSLSLSLTEEKINDSAPDGALKPAKPPSKSNLTVGQKKILELWGAKRLNSQQAAIIQELEKNFTTNVVIEAAKWACTEGMTLGHAINALKTAVPKWGEKRPPPNNNGRGEHPSLTAIREFLEDENA